MQNSYVTYDEIISQTEAWEQALEVAEKKKSCLKELFKFKYDQVIFTGCGSSYYLSLSAGSFFQKISGIKSSGVPAGELLLYPLNLYQKEKKSLLVAVSRSGESTETVNAVKEFINEKRGSVLTITNEGNSSLSKIGDVNLAIPAGQEKSIVQTRAFSSMYVCATAIPLLVFSKNKLFEEYLEIPEEGDNLINMYESLAKEIGDNLTKDRYYFLGSGARYGLACEANLNMKEMSLTHSEPFHFLEFRHGPKSMVNDETVIVAFVSANKAALEMQVINEMKLLGAKIITVAQQQADIILPKHLTAEVINILYLPILQLAAYYRSLAKGLNPDLPNNLDKVVNLENLQY